MSWDVGEATVRLENEPILKFFFRFSYVTGSSLTSPGEPPMILTLRPVNEVLLNILFSDSGLVLELKEKNSVLDRTRNRISSLYVLVF